MREHSLRRAGCRAGCGAVAVVALSEIVYGFARACGAERPELWALVAFLILFRMPIPEREKGANDIRVSLERNGRHLLSDVGPLLLADGLLVFEGRQLSFAFGRKTTGIASNRSAAGTRLYPEGFPEGTALLLQSAKAVELFERWRDAPAVASRKLIPFHVEPEPIDRIGTATAPLLYGAAGAILGGWLQSRVHPATSYDMPLMGGLVGLALSLLFVAGEAMGKFWTNYRLAQAGFV